MQNVFFLFALITSFNSFAMDYAHSWYEAIDEINSDSGIRGPAYDVIVSDLKKLETQFPAASEIITYGRSIEGRPLTLIKIFTKKKESGAKAIYIGGSIHGNEYLNIEDRLPSWILEEGMKKESFKKFFSAGGVIYIAPILNPDGYDRRRRANMNGVDLNRDYTVVKANVVGFKEVETRSLIDYLKADLKKQKLKLEVAVDYHCCVGALLYPWSFSRAIISEADKERHLVIGSITQKNLGKVIKVGQTPIILGYDAKGSSKDFYFEHFNSLGFTFEGRYNVENKYFIEHTEMWTEIVAAVNSFK